MTDRLARGGSGLTVVQRWLLRHASRHSRPDLEDRYRRLLRGASGAAVEMGCGPGQVFAHYPPTVTSVLALERNSDLRARAAEAAERAPVPVEVSAGGPGGSVPLADASVDVVVCCEVLCSVDAPERLLADVRRLLRPGGELRVYEHDLAARRSGQTAQRLVDQLGWPRMMGGCHASRDVSGVIRRAGFDWVDHERVWSARLPLTWPIGPHVLGVARPAHSARGL